MSEDITNALIAMITLSNPQISEKQAMVLLEMLAKAAGDALKEASAKEGAGSRTITHLMQHGSFNAVTRSLREVIMTSMDESEPATDIDDTKTVVSSHKNVCGENDPYYDTRQPPEGFQYPETGTEVIAVRNYGHKGSGGFIPAGSRGIVTGLRMPGTFNEVQGYIGCIVKFDVLVKSHAEGKVIPWDCMHAFSFLYPENVEIRNQ